MTMPHLMNCSHSGDGWCLACVKNLVDDEVVCIKPSTKVLIYGELQAWVVSALLEGGNRLSYKVAWLSGADVKEMWVDSFAISVRPNEAEFVKFGFGSINR